MGRLPNGEEARSLAWVRPGMGGVADKLANKDRKKLPLV